MRSKDFRKIEIKQNESSLVHPSSPIYLISTISKKGIPNIAPYGMVISVSYNPLTYIVSSDKDRDTYRNILETKEFVLNLASTNMIKEIDITGIKFPEDVNEFEEAGFTPIPSIKVKPPRIKECKVHIECRLKRVLGLNKREVIFIAKAVAISIDKDIYMMDFARQKGLIDPVFAVRPNKGRVIYFGLGRFVAKL